MPLEVCSRVGIDLPGSAIALLVPIDSGFDALVGTLPVDDLREQRADLSAILLERARPEKERIK